jgi:hypothetical protein
MKSTAFMLLAVVASFCTALHAESLRCKGDLAQIGDSKASVLQKCGTPFFTESFCKPANQIVLPPASPGTPTVNIVPCELVDEWSYNPGAGQFITILRFEAGAMTSIRYGDRIK